jgi:hypothetical protein
MERVRLKSGRGGPRPNSGGKRPGTGGLQNPPGGRPQTHVFMTAAQMREWAARSGELPHIFLLRIARGEKIDGYKPTFQERIEAAKSCAPFLVPRLRHIEISEAERDPVPRKQLVFNDSELEKLTVEELAVFTRMFKKLTGKWVEPKPEPETMKRYTRTFIPEDLD